MDKIKAAAIREFKGPGSICGIILFGGGICGKVILRDTVGKDARLRRIANGMPGITEQQYEDIFLALIDRVWDFECIIEYDVELFHSTFKFMIKEINESINVTFSQEES